jgi:hypothetical protein
MFFLLFIALCLLIFFIEAPGLIRDKHYKELVIFLILLFIGFFMGLAFFLKWPLNAPFEAIVEYFGD